ncbi:MAG TPA: SRPBCC family protein [Gaiellaceae bacterium]|nr:SRPBCC family protein [Gaiellaceae bacterium]
MFGRKRGIAVKATQAKEKTGGMLEYVDPLAKDEKLRRRLAAAILTAEAARQRLRRQTGTKGLVRRLAGDAVLHAQLVELAAQLQGAQKRAKKARSHKLRNTILFASGVGMVVVAVPAVREKIASLMSGGDDFSAASQQTAVHEEIEVAVPVTAAYNQWTQFEEFPRFMDGVDEVRQLDDTLLHWAATVAGKRAEWDAKIIEQQPDRRITWVSTDGKETRGTVSFEEAGAGRSRVRLQMTYTPEGMTEKVGSAIGLDKRRVRGDLERFRELIEGRQVETGAWRGEVKGGVEKSTDG